MAAGNELRSSSSVSATTDPMSIGVRLPRWLRL
jgi:hypothetical protein